MIVSDDSHHDSVLLMIVLNLMIVFYP
jgi:hypothetical protein